MGYALTNAEVSRRFGALTTEATIPWDRIGVDGLLRTLAGLDARELRQFKRHLQIYEETGKASQYLLGVFAIASGQRHRVKREATVLRLQPDVIGLVFT